MIRESLLQDLSLWGCFWQSTMFIALGFLAGYFLRRRPSRAYQVLLFAMIGAAVVPLMSTVVKHFNLGVFTAEAVELPQVMLQEESVAAPFEQRGDMPDLVVPAVASQAPSDSAFTVMTEAEYSIPWRAIVVYGWMTATLALLVRLAVTFVYGSYLVRHAHRSGCERIQQAVDIVTSKLGFPCGLQVRSSRHVRSPVVWCWSRPSILLVSKICMNPRIDWTGVVAHELAHCKRWDHITGLVAELMVCLLPWNPLMWLSKKYLIRLGEQACDDWVVATGQPSEDYAESLLRFRPQRQMAFLPAVVHSRKGLAGRVDRILRDKCGNPRTGTAWALGVSIFTVCIVLCVACAQTRSVTLSNAKVESQDMTTESLHEAAVAGDVEQVKSLISKGADVNERGVWGNTPLHYSSMRGHAEVAELLISRGAYVNAPDGRNAMTPLHCAAASGNKQTVELLLSKGADINTKNRAGRTPLFEAMKSPEAGRKEIVELMVAKGAKVPVMHLAAYMGDMEKVRKCLQDGIDINSQENFCCTALHAATNGGKKNVTEFLIGRGANIDARDTSGMTPLYYAAIHNCEDIVDFLLSKGADVNAKHEYNFVLLNYAIWDGSKDAIKLLISKGANVNVKDDDGFTLLIWAIWWSDKDMVELIISNGADVDTEEDSYGCTALYWAAVQGSKDLVELLIAKGAPPLSAMHSAACAGDLAKVKSLVKEGTDVNTKGKGSGDETPLFAAVFADHDDVAKFLIAKGADVNAKDKSGQTPLHFACEHGKRNMVELLIAEGADVNAKDNGGHTPLHRMFFSGRARTDIAELLIAKGANVNAKLTSGLTPLNYAVESGYTKIVGLFIAKGADINAPKSDGETPLHEACSTGHKDVVELLIDRGADMNAKNKDGQTALSFAKEKGHTEIVELLRKYGARE